MFDLTNETKSAAATTLVEAVINYDMSDLSYMLQESEMSVENHIKAYQTCLKQALTESDNVIDSQVTAILESANETVGQKLMKILTAMKEWLQKKMAEILSALSKFYENNLDVMNKVGKKVEERLGKGDYAEGPSADLYKYTYAEKLVLGSVDTLIAEAYKGEGYDLSGEYGEGKDEAVKASKAVKSGDIKLAVIKKAYKGGGTLTLANFKPAIHAGVRGDGQRHTVKFGKQYLDALKKDNTAKGVKAVFTGLMAEVDKEKAAIKAKIGEVKKGEDAKAKSAEIGFYHEKIRLLNAAIDGIIAVNAIKIQAANEEVNEAKKFVVRAFAYKKGKGKEDGEGAMNESADSDFPYAFSLIETCVDTLVGSTEVGEPSQVEW